METEINQGVREREREEISKGKCFFALFVLHSIVHNVLLEVDVSKYADP